MDNDTLRRVELDNIVHCKWKKCNRQIPAGPAWKESGMERYFDPDTDCIDRYVLDSGRKVVYSMVEIIYNLR